MELDQLNLPQDVQAKLEQQAAAAGMKPEELASRMIEVEVASGREEQQAAELDNDEWKRRLEKWLASFPNRKTTLDDSRESIYRGRGE